MTNDENGGAGKGVERAAQLFDEHRSFLWALSYRLTGNAADADDIVQDTFVRALSRPPADQARDWRPWLIRVAVNLGRDLLRYRRSRGYPGTWLPSPVEAGRAWIEPVAPAGDPGVRYDLMESLSFAFLLALEALTPTQRAVLLLRDVFDYSGRETAAALGISEANVRTTHSRARRAMKGYEDDRLIRRDWDRAVQALDRFLACVADGDVAGVEAWLAADVRALTDGGGEFHVNVQPVVGRTSVAALFIGLARRSSSVLRIAAHVLNGQPAYVIERTPTPGFAPRLVLTADFDASGRLTQLYTVVASRKLTAVP